MLSLNCQ